MLADDMDTNVPKCNHNAGMSFGQVEYWQESIMYIKKSLNVNEADKKNFLDGKYEFCPYDCFIALGSSYLFRGLPKKALQYFRAASWQIPEKSGVRFVRLLEGLGKYTFNS